MPAGAGFLLGWLVALGLADHPGDDLAQVRAALAERYRVHPVREHHLRHLPDVGDADLAGAVLGSFRLRRPCAGQVGRSSGQIVDGRVADRRASRRCR